jgi:hypothetical protein
MDTATTRTNLLGLTRSELEAFVAGMGEKPFRARQLMKWVYRRGVSDVAAMSDLGKVFRERLTAEAEIRVPEVIHRQLSSDGTRCASRATRPSRWSSSPSRVAARSASRARSAARWTALSARRRSKASTAISMSPRSPARCGWRIASWARNLAVTG